MNHFKKIIKKLLGSSIAITISLAMSISVLPLMNVKADTKPLPTAIGIDVSFWNDKSRGKPIDWQAVKNAGYSFVIIKISKRNPSNGIADGVDDNFEQYYNGAGAAGLKRGVYVFSYAKNASDAADEAQAAIDHLNGRPLELPIAYDIETNPSINKVIKKGKSFTTNVVNSFLNTVDDSQYESMLYTGLYFFNSYIDNDSLDTDKIWIAQYPKIPSSYNHIQTQQLNKFKLPYYMWQFTSTLEVPGASYKSTKGGKTVHHCDVNYIYDPDFADPAFQAKIGQPTEIEPIVDSNDTNTDNTNNTNNTNSSTANVITFDNGYIDLPLNQAKNYQLKVIPIPAGSSINGITYTSSNPSIATVDNNGVLHGQAVGSVAITATLGFSSATTVINITQSQTNVSDIQLMNSSMDMNEGDSTPIQVLVLPDTASKYLKYSSSDPNVATISSSGVIKAIKSGKATITVSADNITKTMTLNVTPAEPVVIPDKKSPKPTNKKKSSTKKKVTSNNVKKQNDTDKANNKTQQKDSKNKNDLTIDDLQNMDNNPTGKAKATDVDKKNNKADKNNSSNPVVQFPVKKVVLGIGQSYNFKANVDKSAKGQKPKYLSKDTTVLSGSSATGHMVAKKPGRIYLVAKVGDNTAKVQVVVKKLPSKVNIKLPSKTLKKGQRSKINLTFGKGTYSAVNSFKSSNKKVLAVSRKGSIRAVSKGIAYVTVTTSNGARSQVKITVK